MPRSKRIILCARCRNLKRHEARGLCKCCYNHVRENRVTGLTLDDFPLLKDQPTAAAGPEQNYQARTSKKDPGFIPMREARNDYH